MTSPSSITTTPPPQSSKERLSDREYLRYNRHVMLESIGEKGQLQLKNSRVLIVGMGGLGCPVAQYLTASGVGHLTLVDHDVVEISNLQRQVLFNHENLQQPKVTAAQHVLSKLNPLVHIQTYQDNIQTVSSHSAFEWTNFDLVLDCSDNKTSRLFVNQACVKSKRRLITAAATRTQGQLMSFDFAQTNSACLECVFPKDLPTPANNCQNAGVLSTLLAVVGGMQANLAIMTLLGQNSNFNTLFTFDAMSLRQAEFRLTLDAQCPVHPV